MIGGVLDGVLQCAYKELDPLPGWKAVVPGSEAVLDECCVGQVWVRLTGLSPRAERNCIVGWDASIEVGVARCVAVLDDQGVSPSAAAVSADAAQMLADMEALQRGLECCVGSVRKVQRLAMGSWYPLTVQGGCAGGSWSIIVTVPDCGCL